MYLVVYDRRVEKDLRAISKPERFTILHKIEQLTAQPRSHQIEKLAGMAGYRLRIGNYRALFTINDQSKIVTIYRILHRREAYR